MCEVSNWYKLQFVRLSMFQLLNWFSSALAKQLPTGDKIYIVQLSAYTLYFIYYNRLDQNFINKLNRKWFHENIVRKRVEGTFLSPNFFPVCFMLCACYVECYRLRFSITGLICACVLVWVSFVQPSRVVLRLFMVVVWTRTTSVDCVQ